MNSLPWKVGFQRWEDAFTITTLADGATVEVPTLAWTHVPGTETYEVRLLQGGAAIKTQETHSTSYTPINLKPGPEQRLHVELRALDKASRTTRIASRTFTPRDARHVCSARAVLDPATYDAPSSAGAPSATRSTGSTSQTRRPVLVRRQRGTDPVRPSLLPVGDRHPGEVRRGELPVVGHAYDKDNGLLGTSSQGRFEVKPLVRSPGSGSPLSGSSLDAGAACAETLSDGPYHRAGRADDAGARLGPGPLAAEYRARIRGPGLHQRRVGRQPAADRNTCWVPRVGVLDLGARGAVRTTRTTGSSSPGKSAIQCGPTRSRP